MPACGHHCAFIANLLAHTASGVLVAGSVIFSGELRAQDPAARERERAYEQVVVPLVARYCGDCHGAKTAEAELDLTAQKSLPLARQRVRDWRKVRELLESRQMPPKEAPQPSAAEHAQLAGWVRDFLAREAAAAAGDPGPVLLRRLSNAEYAYTLRDLTEVAALDPAAEFPVDGAAGEGFTNAGSGQGMSPALVQKYLDAARATARHLVLTPSGVRFSPFTSSRDQTNELLARIQAFYRRYTDDGGGVAVNLQGIKFDTNQGGLLPLRRYLAALLEERDALTSGKKSPAEIAQARSLSPRYLALLWEKLGRQPEAPASPLLAALGAQLRAAKSTDPAPLSAQIEPLQKKLWKFNSIGHLGRTGGAKAWLEPVENSTQSQEIRLPLVRDESRDEVVFYLATSDLGDGRAHDFALWRRPRLEYPADKGPSPPGILLRDLRWLAEQFPAVQRAEVARTADYLLAARKLHAEPTAQRDEVARGAELNEQLLARWQGLLALGDEGPRAVTGHFRTRLTKVGGKDAVNGWGSEQTPSLLANRAREAVSLGTPTIPARGVTVHPSPRQEAFVAWRSPISGAVSISAALADADAQCGNGFHWRLELLTAVAVRVLEKGEVNNGQRAEFKLPGPVAVAAGDVVRLVIGPRGTDHTCDTTQVALTLEAEGGDRPRWDLAEEIVERVLEGNPLADRFGQPEVWHFGATGEKSPEPLLPADTALGRWRAAVTRGAPDAELAPLTTAAARTLTAGAGELAPADALLQQQLLTLQGPLNWLALAGEAPQAASAGGRLGVDPGLFGKHPAAREMKPGGQVDAADLCVQAPSVLEVRLPAALASGAVLVATAELHPATAGRGSVQFFASQTRPDPRAPQWGLGAAAGPVLTGAAAAAEFRELFPPALCYARIVPVDEVVTLTLYHREDALLRRLMLSDAEAAELDGLWDELFFVAQEPLALAVAYEQLAEFATQDRPDLVQALRPLKAQIEARAAAFRERMQALEPRQLEALLALLPRAWRRPLTAAETHGLRGLYTRLRASELPHDEALRLLLARALTSPAFLYKLETQPAGQRTARVNDWELASRLSYFLTSSAPDAELHAAARSGGLGGDAELLAQSRRLLAGPQARRLAIQFACQWLQVRDFDQNNDKNEQLFPEFAALRGEMYEETVRFCTDLFQSNGSIVSLLDADHTFVSPALAKHYGLPPPAAGEWRRVSGVQAKGRGGVLGMASVLASQSGASRTSPILRGNWVYETLLGQRLPRPPAGVPVLPETPPQGLTERQLIEQHSSVAACVKCHIKIDPFGFALEQYDPLGRLRAQPVDTKTKLESGQTLAGLGGLRGYLVQERRDDFVRQFCRKLLGYALGREVQLSDEPLLGEMHQRLAKEGYRVQTAVEMIVLSRQFREIRGELWRDEP